MMTWILENIVKQIESGTESWRAESRGGKSLANEQGELYDKKHLKSDVLQEAEQLQHKNLIQIKWTDGYRGSDIERIRYRLEDKEKFYALYQQEVNAGFLPKQEKVRLYQEFAEELETETLEKLKLVQDENPQIQELIRKLLETGKGMEQECFLIEKRGNHI